MSRLSACTAAHERLVTSALLRAHLQVISDRANKTVLVAVDRWLVVPKYRKRMRRTSKFMAHDEENDCRMGDIVRIHISRCSSWSWVTSIMHLLWADHSRDVQLMHVIVCVARVEVLGVPLRSFHAQAQFSTCCCMQAAEQEQDVADDGDSAA